jgi:hypothetical protein
MFEVKIIEINCKFSLTENILEYNVHPNSELCSHKGNLCCGSSWFYGKFQLFLLNLRSQNKKKNNYTEYMFKKFSTKKLFASVVMNLNTEMRNTSSSGYF